MTREELLERIQTADLAVPVAGAIEHFLDQFPVGQSEKPVFERLLRSPLTENRSAALAALLYGGRFTGYEADAVLLHYMSRHRRSSPEEFAAIDYLRQLHRLGSDVAERILVLLDCDPYVRAMWGDEE